MDQKRKCAEILSEGEFVSLLPRAFNMCSITSEIAVTVKQLKVNFSWRNMSLYEDMGREVILTFPTAADSSP